MPYELGYSSLTIGQKKSSIGLIHTSITYSRKQFLTILEAFDNKILNYVVLDNKVQILRS